MHRNIRRFNKTFNIGETHLNACVGNNGVQDLEIYGEGYDLATRALIESTKRDPFYIDATIYPLIFCARHRLELFLKDQLLKLKEIRQNNEITEEKLVKTHDLKMLLDLYKEHGKKTDNRFSGFIDKYEEYFLDFAEIDATGETFRYPYSKLKTLHLIQTPIISIAILEKRYTELSEKLKEIGRLTNYLINEYSQGTFTNNLSREDIKNISIALPNKDKWVEICFSNIKDGLKIKYKIGSKELTDVINIIQNHRQFCVNIGLEIPLVQISADEFDKYVQLYGKFYDCDEKNKSEEIDAKAIREGTKMLPLCIKELQKNLSKKAIICIYTLIELGRDYFSEAYDRLYSTFSKVASHEYNFSEYCRYIFTNCRALTLIEKALLNSGQESLLKKLIIEPKTA